MKVLLAGEMPFLAEIGQLCVAAGYETDLYLGEDFLSAREGGALLGKMEEIAAAIELHHESLDTKRELLQAMSKRVGEETLILTTALNSSTTQAASWVKNPARVVGFGVLPPLATNRLVELARALQTGDVALAQAQQFWQGMEMETAVVADGPGLVRARTVCCIINEAASALMEGVANASDIDRAMQLGANYPHGPLAWADHLGLDTVLGVMQALFAEWGEDRYRPAPLLRHMVAAGRLGRKTGAGFYQYET
jgi:3-hydroxybutyryl-CoA dehydrogenase